MPNPDRIELVRRRLGLTKSGLADRLKIDRKVLQRFESGEFGFPDPSLDALCKETGYPRAFFEKGQFEFPSAHGVSFRSLRSLTAGTRDSALAAGALAFEFDDWIAAKYDLPAHQIPQIEQQSPEQSAAFVRAKWGIGERPIGNMLNLLESKGVRVFSLAEETRHLDAYSFWRDDKQPYVFLNTLKTAERTRFDAAHELGHLVMHRHSGATNPNAETEANAFASAFLMPPADVLAEIPRVRSLEHIIEAKKRWGVSASALCYTLNKLGRLTEWNYRSHNVALAQMKNEPNGIPRETSQIWTKILTDLWRQGIPLARVADELAIPEWELNSLLFGIASTQAPGGPPSASAPLRLVSDA